MASPELAIAKAALSASLFKEDPVSLTRPEVETLFPLLDAAIIQCSRHNVQSCKNWIMTRVASSPARCANLAKYLAALSKCLPTDTNTRPSLKRRRLHILYILSDALHHAARADNRVCAEAWATHLVTLVAAAAAFDRCPKHKAKLAALIALWADKGFLPEGVLAQLRDAVSNNGNITAAQSDPAPAVSSLKVSKDAPYMLPSCHGDASTPWYDLPAGTWLPHLTPNSARPMLPDRIRPIQLSAGPADAPLVDAIKALLRRADRIYSNSSETDSKHLEASGEDINELGERFVVDPATGAARHADTYYGWSRSFCEKMKARRTQMPRSDSRGRSYSRSSSQSRSPSPSRKRTRRYSSDSRSRSRTPPPRNRNRSRDSSPGQARPSQFPQHRPHENVPFPPALGGLHPHPQPLPPPPQAGFPLQWPLPPPPPPPPVGPGNMGSWTPDPALMSQMMAAWSASQGLPPPPPLPLPPQGYQGGPQQAMYDGRGGHGNQRGRGGHGRGRGR